MNPYVAPDPRHRWWNWKYYWSPVRFVFKKLAWLGLWEKPEGESYWSGRWTWPSQNERGKQLRSLYSFWGWG